MGSVVIFQKKCPLVGCRFSRHVATHVPSIISYLRENLFIFTVYQFSAPPPPPLLLLPHAHSLLQLLAPRHCMSIKRVAHCKRMAKKGAKKQAVGWTGSSIADVDLAKMKKEWFLAESAEVIFPSTEVIPAPPPRFRVMFLAFLLHGFSLPAHKFLRGLMFVYGVQQH
jgi:hypothetical protein